MTVYERPFDRLRQFVVPRATIQPGRLWLSGARSFARSPAVGSLGATDQDSR